MTGFDWKGDLAKDCHFETEDGYIGHVWLGGHVWAVEVKGPDGKVIWASDVEQCWPLYSLAARSLAENVVYSARCGG